MNQSVFEIPKMDCPAEEQLIRLALADAPAVARLYFDLPGRRLTVLHTGEAAPLAQRLAGLRLGSTLLETTPAATAAPVPAAPREQRMLVAVLGINAFFFVLEMGAGWLARSLGLVADSLDMLADALVYGLALYAVGRAAGTQQRVARAAGYLQLALAIGGFVETGRRFLYPEPSPRVGWMLGIAGLALLGNWATLHLLGRARPGQAHIQASQIFTSTDIIVNLGVMLAAGLVYLTRSPWPDLLVGLVVFGLVARGARQIFALSASPSSPPAAT